MSNPHPISFLAELHYDLLEIGTGSDPTDVWSRQKLIAGNIADQTFSTYNGDLWVAFSAEDIQAGDDVTITLLLDDSNIYLSIFIHCSVFITRVVIG